MCGIAGVFSFEERISLDENKLNNVYDDIKHRGPDSMGHLYIDDSCLLIHSRLSIVNLTSSGDQPLVSNCGRYVLVINGEVYNYKELALKCKVELDVENISDSLVALEFISEHGVDDFLKEAQGMWAFALYDKVQKSLKLCRDVAGQKPLYYCYDDRTIFFASTISACLNFRETQFPKRAIKDFICTGSFDLGDINVVCLEPGNVYEFVDSYEALNISRYFNLEVDRKGSFEISQLKELLLRHVRWTLRSDAPLGLFLSGGIDSRLVAALASRLSKSELVAAYSVSFKEKGYDESIEARSVAKFLKIDFREVIITASHVKRFFDEANFQEFDFMSDTSFLPIYWLSMEAKKDVKVVLTGDGADELFGGYNRHLFKYSSSFKYSLMRLMSKSKLIGKIVLNLTRVFSLSQMERLVQKALLSNQRFNGSNHYSGDIDVYHDLLHRDFHEYLPIVLNKVDQSTMANGIESRTPFLNEEIIRYAFQLEIDELITNGLGKVPLRQILNTLRLGALKRKSGFTPPFPIWFRRDLKEWLQTSWSNLHGDIKAELEILYGQNSLDILLSDVSKHQEILWRCLFLDRKIRSLEQNTSGDKKSFRQSMQ